MSKRDENNDNYASSSGDGVGSNSTSSTCTTKINIGTAFIFGIELLLTTSSRSRICFFSVCPFCVHFLSCAPLFPTTFFIMIIITVFFYLSFVLFASSWTWFGWAALLVQEKCLCHILIVIYCYLIAPAAHWQKQEEKEQRLTLIVKQRVWHALANSVDLHGMTMACKRQITRKCNKLLHIGTDVHYFSHNVVMYMQLLSEIIDILTTNSDRLLLFIVLIVSAASRTWRDRGCVRFDVIWSKGRDIESIQLVIANATSISPYTLLQFLKSGECGVSLAISFELCKSVLHFVYFVHFHWDLRGQVSPAWTFHRRPFVDFVFKAKEK